MLASSMEAELVPIRQRAAELRAEPARVEDALASGADHCRSIARETMHRVRDLMGFAPVRAPLPTLA
ncbi:MAG: hypothetical protein H0W68_13085 [Gemmatimonadaceae bacterium]|nr:hypothetical protein [Gemmatimonadaceae bacterium]